MMTPIGTIIANNILVDSTYLVYINAIVIGVFLHISTTILFESSDGHSFNLNKILAIVVAVAVAYFV